MAKGRPRIPTKLHALRGNPGKRPLPAEPDIPTEVPDPPTWLDADARLEWDRVTPILLQYGLVTQHDLAGLVGYCQIWGEIAKCSRHVTEHGWLHVDKHGNEIVTAAARQLLKLRDQLPRYAALFGLSPQDRSRLYAQRPAKRDETPPIEKLRQPIR